MHTSTMNPSNIAAEKDIEPPTGHPALACDSPVERPSITSPPARYYQRFPPGEAVTPTSRTSEKSEFDFRSADPAHVKSEPTILDKVKEVLHLHKRL